MKDHQKYEYHDIYLESHAEPRGKIKNTTKMETKWKYEIVREKNKIVERTISEERARREKVQTTVNSFRKNSQKSMQQDGFEEKDIWM